MNGARALDELRCSRNHVMMRLQLLPDNDKSEYLTCQACAQPFRQDSASFGCAECDEDICYKCVKGLPESLKRKSVRERLKPGSGHFSTTTR